MRWLLIFGLPLVASCAEPQKPTPITSEQAESTSDRVKLAIRLLGDEDPTIRERAARELRNAGDTAVPSIKSTLEKTQDLEVRARLQEALRGIARDDARSLYQGGKLHEALLKLAEAEGAGDREAYVTEKIARTKQDILKYLPDPTSPNGRCANDAAAAEEILKRGYGPWLMPTLLDALGGPVTQVRIPADLVLTKMGRESTPYLCQALVSSNKTLAYRALSIFYTLGSTDDPKVLAALESLLAEPNLPEDASKMARAIYLHSTGKLPNER